MRRLYLALGVTAFTVLGIALALRSIDNGAESPPLALLSRAALEGADPNGASADTGIKGIVEYTVRGPDGRIKKQETIYNTVNNEGLNDTFNLITATGSGTYDGIAAMSVAVGTDDPSDGVLAASITLLLDGDGGTGGEQNPADGNVTTDFGTETGNGTVDVTFTATGATDIRQIVLTRAPEDDTLVGGAAAIADADIFAYVDVPDISLTASDTVTYTWTVDVD